MAKKHIEDTPPHDRRRFFTRSLARLLEPMAGYIEKKLPADPPDTPHIFRPPGAIAKRDFLKTCYRCGGCADECPAGAISIIRGLHERIDGTPRLDPNLQACILCDDLACTKVCPSGALALAERHEIRIGIAEIDHALCNRSKDEDCTECITHCPIGKDAIQLDDQGTVQIIVPKDGTPGCVGCGVCVKHCPTQPPEKAIRVVPT